MTPKEVHWTAVGSLLGLGVLAAFMLGTDHAHGMFNAAFFLIAVAIFGSIHAFITTLAVRKWGSTTRRVLLIHAAVLFGAPTLFGVVASIVA